MRVLETPRFRKQVKRLRPNQRTDLDLAIREVASNPRIGEQKKGELSWVRVYKGRLVGQLFLLAYEVRDDEELIILHAIASHENFYRDLKAKQ